MEITDLLTPALVLDRARLAANTQAMTARLKSHGVDLRPHLKTSKSVDVARLATDGNFGGVTVSTLAEARYFLDHGVTDMVYAVCLAANKLDAVAQLIADGANLKVLIDNVETAKAIAAHGGGQGARHRVLIEIDCGEHRTGIAPGDGQLLEMAGILTDAPGVELAGVLTHAGHSYLCRSEADMVRVAEDERLAATTAAGRLRDAGFACPIVSVGSTPTATFARDLSGVTEARPGVYVFYDLFQAGIGVCQISDIALSVVATVTAHRRESNALMIDAGGLALSKDRSTGGLDDDCGFGLVCDLATAAPLPGLVVSGVHQEHGLITSRRADIPLPYDRLPIGTRVRVLPNHACMTAAAYQAYNVTDGGTHIVATWGRCNGW